MSAGPDVRKVDAAIASFFAMGRTDYCEACGGDGYTEEATGPGHASEPTWREVTCEVCGGAG